MTDELTLKWGTLKGWRCESDAMKEAKKAYMDAGGNSVSAMLQHDTAAQKAALCALIDATDGEIWNDWDGVVMTKDAAKKYVMEYGATK